MKIESNNKDINFSVKGSNDVIEMMAKTPTIKIESELSIDTKDLSVGLSEKEDVIDMSFDQGFIIQNGSGSSNKCYVVRQDNTADVESALKKLHTKNFKQGDMLIIISLDETKVAGYVYTDDCEWVSFSGNVYADNVIFTDDILCAGNYSQVGNITKTASGTETIESKGKSLADVMEMIFTKELQPTMVNPSAKITINSGAVEVGKAVIPSYTVTFNEGSYSYDNTTGVKIESVLVEDVDGNMSVSPSDTFPGIYVVDNTNYYVNLTLKHSYGNIAKTNLGKDSKPVVKIAAGTIKTKSASITGYRPYFYGILATSSTDEPLDTTVIRSLINGGNYNGSKKFTISVNDQPAKRIVVAIPSTSTRSGLTKVEKTDGLVTDITSTYKVVANVQVEDFAGSNPIDYKIWVYEPAVIDGREVHDIYLG